MPRTAANPAVTPISHVFDRIQKQFALKHDAALARFLKMPPPVVSKLRNGLNRPSGDNLIRIHMATGYPIVDLVRDTEYTSARRPRG